MHKYAEFNKDASLASQGTVDDLSSRLTIRCVYLLVSVGREILFHDNGSRHFRLSILILHVSNAHPIRLIYYILLVSRSHSKVIAPKR